MVWTKSASPLSVAIRFLLSSDCSHWALVFDTPAGGLMFESNLLGTHPKFFRTALAHATLVHEIALPLHIVDEDEVWDEVVAHLDGRSYDWGAFFFFAWRAALQKFFWVPMPKVNRWAQPGTDLCVEVFAAVKKFTALKDVQLELSMTGPHELYQLLTANPELHKLPAEGPA
jgi:hypothetical protein